MKLYEPSIFLEDYSSLSFAGSLAAAATDNDKNTLANSSSQTPALVLDAGASELRTANSLWLRSTGYSRVELRFDNPSQAAGAWDIPADGYLYVEFTEAESRYWRLNFTGTGGIYEVYLSKRILDFDVDGKRPLKVRWPRFGGIFVRAASGDLLNFQTFGFGGGRAQISMEWTLLDNESVALLRTSWKAGIARNSLFGVYPLPENRPRHFFQARWESPFDFKYAGTKVSDGQSGGVLLQERDISIFAPQSQG